MKKIKNKSNISLQSGDDREAIGICFSDSV